MPASVRGNELLKGSKKRRAGLRGSGVETRSRVDQDVVKGMSLLLLRLIPNGPGSSSRGRALSMPLSDRPTRMTAERITSDERRT